MDGRKGGKLREEAKKRERSRRARGRVMGVSGAVQLPPSPISETNKQSTNRHGGSPRKRESSKSHKNERDQRRRSGKGIKPLAEAAAA